MSLTLSVMESIQKRLTDTFGSELDVSYYPEDPQSYRLNHPIGALLIGFSSAVFSNDRSIDATFVERALTIPITFVFRMLNGPDGVINYLDRIRTNLTGITLPHCDRPLIPTAEHFVSQDGGVWQYSQDWTTRTLEVQAFELVDSQGLKNMEHKEIL